MSTLPSVMAVEDDKKFKVLLLVVCGKVY